MLLRYLPLFVGSVTGAAIPREFATAPAFFWSIVLLDTLGVVVPATVAAAMADLRGSPLAVPATHAVVGWFALVPPSVAAMAVMVVRDDPYASVPTLVLLAVTSIITTAVAVRMSSGSYAAPARCVTQDYDASGAIAFT